MKESGQDVSEELINKAITYLEKEYKSSLDNSIKAEIYWALKYA
jgi:hypothetical protein